MIYYKWYIRSNAENSEDDRDLIVVPQSLYETVIKLYHDGIENCHSGVENSVDSCRRKFWFYRMQFEFELYIRSCEKCNAIKQPRKYSRPPLKPIIFREFNQGIAIDHVIPSQNIVTKNRNRYILSITCLYTGYLVAVPVKSVEAQVTVEAILKHWITIFGWPTCVLSDNHKSFDNNLFKAVSEIFGFDAKKITPYHSQGAGRIESQNKRINACMRAILSADKFREWDKYLKYIVFSLNSLKCKRTNVSANFLVFGRNLKSPRDLWLEDLSHINIEPDMFVNVDNLKKKTAYDLHKKIREINLKVQRTMGTHVQNMCNAYNKKANFPDFKVGEKCYIKINVPENKFSARWEGPGQILKKLSDNLYVVLVKNAEKVVNVTKMKPYTHSKYYPKSGNNQRVKEFGLPDKKATECNTPKTDSDNLSVDDLNDLTFLINRPITSTGIVNPDLQSILDNSSNVQPRTSDTTVTNPEHDTTTATTAATAATATTAAATANIARDSSPSRPGQGGIASRVRSNPRIVQQTERLNYPADHVRVDKRKNPRRTNRQ